jgi:hypothetical protein
MQEMDVTDAANAITVRADAAPSYGCVSQGRCVCSWGASDRLPVGRFGGLRAFRCDSQLAAVMGGPGGVVAASTVEFAQERAEAVLFLRD